MLTYRVARRNDIGLSVSIFFPFGLLFDDDFLVVADVDVLLVCTALDVLFAPAVVVVAELAFGDEFALLT